MSHDQFKALYHFLTGRDTFACLPTGHGKTLMYRIAVKMEQELFDNDDKPTELEEAEVVYVLQTSRDGSVAKPRSMLNKAIFDTWQRSLFFRQRTPGKEPLLAGNKLVERNG